MAAVHAAGQRPKAKNAWLWGCVELSDVKFQLSAANSEGVDLAVHAVVLAANSLYFRAKLLDKSGSSSNSPRMLQEHLASGQEVEAAHLVLSHMYKEIIECTRAPQLITALKLADQWQAEDTVAACSAAFAALAPEEVDAETIQRAYCLEGDFRSTACFNELFLKVESRLMSMFSDLVVVMRNPGLQAQLLQLPFAAMIALLRSEHLMVDSENTVLAAANLWITRGLGQSTTDQQKELLASTVRLPSLSTSYMCGVIPNLKWFVWPKQAPGAYYTALQCRMISKEASQLLQTHTRQGGAGANLPSQPTTAPTAGQPSSYSTGIQPLTRRVNGHNLELVCDIENDRLTQYIQDGVAGLQAANAQGGGFFKGIHVTSECSYFNGFMWGIKVVFGFSSGSSSMGGSALVVSRSNSGDSTSMSPEDQLHSMSLKSAQDESSSHGSIKQANGTAAFTKSPAQPQFTVTPSVFAALPPGGEEGIAPIHTPINTTFRCTLEAIGDYNTPYSAATFQGASFMRPGDESVSSIGISNFFKKIGAQQGDPAAWKPFLYGGNMLRLKLQVTGNSVE